MSLTQFLSYGDMLAWLLKNTNWHRCFQVRHMLNLPRLNGCGASNERQYCFSSADEILVTFNEPFFHNMSLTEILSFWRLCWHGRARIHPDIDVSKNAICAICRDWMAAGYQMKGNIVFYLLMKYVSLLTSRFSAICLWLNSCHMGICWHDCSRIQPDIDVSKNAICTIRRGWMAAGYQMKGNIVFYLLMKYFSILTSHFTAICL